MSGSPPPGARKQGELAVAAALATVVLWASAFPLIGIAVSELAPAEVAAVRFAIAAVALGTWTMLAGSAMPARSDLARLALCGLIGIALYNILLNTGQRTVPAGCASLIVAIVPILTAGLAAAFLRERLGKIALAGMLLSFSGVLAISARPLAGTEWTMGIAAIAGAALCQAIYFILQKPLIGRYGPLTATAYAVAAGAICLLPWLPSGAAAAADASLSVAGALLFLGLLPGALGYVTWSYALGDLGPGGAAPFLYLVPPAAIGLAVPLNNEVPDLRTVSAGALVLLGVALANHDRGFTSPPAGRVKT